MQNLGGGQKDQLSLPQSSCICRNTFYANRTATQVILYPSEKRLGRILEYLGRVLI